MTIIKDPAKAQQREVDLANKYINESINNTLGRVGKNAMMQKGEEEGFESPIYKTAEAIGRTIQVMGNRLQALNADTTKTEDAVTLEQANILDKGIAEAKDILDGGVRSLKSAHNATSQTLFSRKANLHPEVMAMLGNDTIMKEMRADYLSYIGDERTATLLNTFNKYGVLGDEEKQTNIDKALNRKHTPEAVERLDMLGVHAKRMQELEEGLTLTHQLLSTNTEKIVGLRARKL